jgi:hypothetical protein
VRSRVGMVRCEHRVGFVRDVAGGSTHVGGAPSRRQGSRRREGARPVAREAGGAKAEEEVDRDGGGSNEEKGGSRWGIGQGERGGRWGLRDVWWDCCSGLSVWSVFTRGRR